MAEILHFPGTTEAPRPPLDLGAEGLQGAAAILSGLAAILSSLSAKLIVCPKDKATRLAALVDAEERITESQLRLKTVQHCLDLVLIVEDQRP